MIMKANNENVMKIFFITLSLQQIIGNIFHYATVAVQDSLRYKKYSATLSFYRHSIPVDQIHIHTMIYKSLTTSL